MKKLLLLLSFWAVAGWALGQGFVTGNGQALGSNFVVFSENNEPFTIVVNGIQLNNRPVANIKVANLVPGPYIFRILPINPAVPAMEIDLQVQGGRELTYAIVTTPRGGRRMVFVNEFSLRFNPAPPVQQLVVEYQGGLQVNPTPVPNPTVPPVVVPNPTINPPVIVDPGPLPGYNGPIGCQGPMMDPQSFSQARASIQGKTFSSSKMTLAKQITRSNCLLADQVRDITRLFDYESDRLEYAKFAYPFTYDQGNYFKINDAFEFESSISNLERFLQGR